MGVIRGVLKEELDNSHKVVARYQDEVAKLKGALVKKKVGNKYYYYLAVRDGKKVRFVYKGKALSKEFLAEFEKSKRLRRKYNGLIKQLTIRIKYLRKVLHGKENV